MATKLYVGNLSYDTTEDELRQLFAQAGEVQSVSLPTERGTGRPRGFGFVEMVNEQDAQQAISRFNGYSLRERELRVNEARPPEQRSGGGGSRGGGGGGRGGYGGGGSGGGGSRGGGGRERGGRYDR
ncbi:MAG: RNA-binding protein [Chloroflexi bacterium]|nr:RNA-binding protein [Chloroflexota bacterium]